MKKQNEVDNSFFGGFEAVIDGLARTERKPSRDRDPDDDGFETVTEIRNDIDELPMTDPEDIINQLEDQDNGVQGKTKAKKITEEEVEDSEEEEEETQTRTVTAVSTTEETSDLGEYETDVVDFFTDQFTSKLGWEIEDDKKPKTVDDIVEFIKEIVETSSTPQYASEEIEKLNSYVANGGDLKKFYTETYGEVDFDTIDIDNENVQRKLLTDNFSRLGYSPDRIKKYISRYEDSGTMQEEAEDALDSLKEYRKTQSEKLLAEQENMRKEQVKQQQNFYTNVYNSIEKTDSIRGIPISPKEKKELNDYIFKPEADGLTKYQKDYAKDYKNLIESAYFTMKGDSLIQKVTQKATSQAAKNLQDKLANKGKRVKNSGATQGVQSNSLNAWSTVSRQLRRPNF